MAENSLVIFTKAAQMLAEADTIQKAKELKDLALTAADWARRKGMGEQAIQYARSYAERAERRMGVMLAETDRAKPPAGPGRGKLGTRPLPAFANLKTPTLTELGITKNESSRAQKKAELSESEFEKIVTGEKTFSKIQKEKNLCLRRERVIKETKAAAKQQAHIIKADCLKILDDVPPIDLLLADPPYFTDGNFTEHIRECLAKVKPTGQAYVFLSGNPAEVAAYLSMDGDNNEMILVQILVWRYDNTGQRQPNDRYNSNYQLVFYFRGPKANPINKPSDGTHQYACQTVNAPDGRMGDRFHEWQKPIDLIDRYILNSSNPGDFVFDPFAGTGTTLLSAAKLGRKSFGCDIDDRAVKIAIERGCVLG